MKYDNLKLDSRVGIYIDKTVKMGKFSNTFWGRGRSINKAFDVCNNNIVIVWSIPTICIYIYKQSSV